MDRDAVPAVIRERFGFRDRRDLLVAPDKGVDIVPERLLEVLFDLALQLGAILLLAGEDDIAAGDESCHVFEFQLLEERLELTHGWAAFAQVDAAEKGNVAGHFSLR